MIKYVITLRFLLIFFIFMTLLMTSITSISKDDSNKPLIYTITIDDVITKGTTSYIARSITTAEEDNAAALVLLINTPGGLVDATLTIMEDILAAEIPIIVYVSPSGAISASAGSFILVGSDIAAMAPGTTCGAAMPVTFGIDEEGTSTNAADEKTITFLSGHISSVAEEQNHNGETAKKFVTENLTLNANEALEMGVIDYVSPTLQSLIMAINGTSLTKNTQNIPLHFTDPIIIPLSMTTQEKATAVISNPQISFILVLIGIYGLVIGFNAPQTYIPEVGGAIAVIIGLYGLGLFEINLFAVIMILLGVLLLIAEAMTPTYGVLSIGGIFSIVVGGFFLPREPLMPSEWFINLRFLVLGVGIGGSILMLIVLKAIFKVRSKSLRHGSKEFNGYKTKILAIEDERYLLKVNGELWHGISSTSDSFTLGEQVIVVGRKDMCLLLESIKSN